MPTYVTANKRNAHTDAIHVIHTILRDYCEKPKVVAEVMEKNKYVEETIVTGYRTFKVIDIDNFNNNIELSAIEGIYEAMRTLNFTQVSSANVLKFRQLGWYNKTQRALCFYEPMADSTIIMSRYRKHELTTVRKQATDWDALRTGDLYEKSEKRV